MSPSQVTLVKDLSSVSLELFPEKYTFFNDPNEIIGEKISHEEIPVVDFSLLESKCPKERSLAIEGLKNACQEWGFFMVVNHGIPDRLMKGIVDVVWKFFNLSQEDKKEYEGKDVLAPIRCGTSYNPSVEEVHFWRDYLKVMVHPKFHSPTKPHDFSEIASEYSKRVWHIVRTLLGGLSLSLGLDEREIEKLMDLEHGGNQVLIGNFYPPCPRPDLAVGLPPHSDHGLLTILVHNQIGGLQIFREGKWVSISSPTEALLVNVADQLEIVSNGKYKSMLHRVMVNNEKTRVSVAIANGPTFGAVVQPAPKLTEGDGGAEALYKPMTYREYLRLQQTNRLVGKSGLDIVRV